MRHRWFMCFLSVVLLLVAVSKATADVLTLTRTDCCQTQQHLRVLLDPAGQLHFGQVRALQPQFQMPLRDDFSYGYRQGAIWLQLEVQPEQAGRWWWQFNYPSLDLLELYLEDSQGVRQLVSGDMVAPATRAVAHRQPVFPLDLRAGEVSRLWLRVQSEGSMTLQNEILSERTFIERTADQYLAPALYFGALLALAGYNLLLFLVLRERSFLWYVLFVSCFGIGAASLNGLGALYLWPAAVNNQMLPFGFTAASLMAILFTRSFLNTATFSPQWDRYLRPMVALMAAATVATLIMPVQSALIIMSLVGILVVLLLTICAIQGLQKKAPGALLFAIAWSMLLLGTVVMSLRNLGILPSNFLTVHAMQLGSALEMLLVSFGMAARFNALKQQHSAMQQQALESQQQLVAQLKAHEFQLEQKVAERTQALELMNERLHQLASTDALTGLANRNAMYQQLHQAIARTRRQRSSLALLYLDLDGFKRVNDQFGHLVGDKVLREASARLHQVLRESDLICRIGGDEFLLICEGLTRGPVLQQLTERLLAQLKLPFVHEDQQIWLGVSIGVAISDGGHSEAEQLIDAADRAMYQAKAAGKNCVKLAADIA